MDISLSNLERFVDGARQHAWLLYNKTEPFTLNEGTGVLFFDMLTRMGYESAHASFIVMKTLEFAEDLREKLVLQLIDRWFLLLGDNAWDVQEMTRIEDLPQEPMISMAIAVHRLADQLLYAADASPS